MNSGNKLKMCLLVGTFSLLVFSASENKVQAAGIKNGEEGFKKYCAACHPNGGNVLKPTKNIMKNTLEKNGIKTANDIVKLMRKPSGEMTAFNENTLPENDAKKIAEFVIKTFK